MPRRFRFSTWITSNARTSRVVSLLSASHVPKGQHTMVAAAVRQAFLQADADGAQQTWRHVADQLRPRWPKLTRLMDESEADVSAYMVSRHSTGASCTRRTLWSG